MELFSKSQEEANYNRYKIHRNEVQRKIKVVKKNYITYQIKRNNNYLKYLWESLKELGCRGTDTTSNRPSNIGLDIAGSIEFDKDKVANTFNSFFLQWLAN